MGFIYAIFLLLGLVLIIFGGNLLVKSSIEISKATKIPEFIIGATVVSIVTTMPEFLVTIYSCQNGMVDLAIGNAIGSMLFNITLIIGVCLVFMPTPIRRKSINRNMSTLILSTVLFYIFVFDGTFNKVQGGILFALYVINFVLNFVCSKNDKDTVCHIESIPPTDSLVITLLNFVIAAAMVSVGANLLVKHGENIARLLGISQHIIGSTVIAIGTSIPDLVTAISCIRLKKTSIVIGSTIGANIINSTLLVGISSFFSKGLIHINPNIINFAMPLLFVAILIIYLPILIKQKTYRWQGGMLLAITLTYYVTLFL